MSKDKIEVLQITMKDDADGFQALLKNNNLYTTGDDERYYIIPKFFKELSDDKYEIMTPDQVPDKVRQSVLKDFLSKEELIYLIRGVSHNISDYKEFYPWDLNTLADMDKFQLEILYDTAKSYLLKFK